MSRCLPYKDRGWVVEGSEFNPRTRFVPGRESPVTIVGGPPAHDRPGPRTVVERVPRRASLSVKTLVCRERPSLRRGHITRLHGSVDTMVGGVWSSLCWSNQLGLLSYERSDCHHCRHEHQSHAGTIWRSRLTGAETPTPVLGLAHTWGLTTVEGGRTLVGAYPLELV